MCTQASILYNDIIILADLELDKIRNKTRSPFLGLAIPILGEARLNCHLEVWPRMVSYLVL
jgi:hypothetical protein